MTESDWHSCTDSTPMLEFLRGKDSERKLRLFACACCRRIWHLLKDERSRNAVVLAEQYVDDLATASELEMAAYAALEASFRLQDECEPGRETPMVHAAAMAFGVAGALSNVFEASGFSAWDHAVMAAGDNEGRQNQCVLLREIFGNPFRHITIDPRWLNSTVVDLATTIYNERAFDKTPILADALTDAGCDNEEIIGHCRSEGPHVRGCWVVDLLLGKE
jgi:hypothetical protein